ncbi:hypothetical protein T439DRAFT_348910 [Meredithblackwellia eburnea MCA 4105]
MSSRSSSSGSNTNTRRHSIASPPSPVSPTSPSTNSNKTSKRRSTSSTFVSGVVKALSFDNNNNNNNKDGSVYGGRRTQYSEDQLARDDAIQQSHVRVTSVPIRPAPSRTRSASYSTSRPTSAGINFSHPIRSGNNSPSPSQSPSPSNRSPRPHSAASNSQSSAAYHWPNQLEDDLDGDEVLESPLDRHFSIAPPPLPSTSALRSIPPPIPTSPLANGVSLGAESVDAGEKERSGTHLTSSDLPMGTRGAEDVDLFSTSSPSQPTASSQTLPRHHQDLPRVTTLPFASTSVSPISPHSPPLLPHSFVTAPAVATSINSRQLSPAALAALADTPPRVVGNFQPGSSTGSAGGRPPSLPPKSSARLASAIGGGGPIGIGAIKQRDSGASFDSVEGVEDVFTGNGSSPNNSSSNPRSSIIGGRILQTTSTSPFVSEQQQQLPPPATTSPVLPPTSTPPTGLTHPRPRANAPLRTPSLSQAGSSSSRASSSVFTPGSSNIARSSVHSTDGTDWGGIGLGSSVGTSSVSGGEKEDDDGRYGSVKIVEEVEVVGLGGVRPPGMSSRPNARSSLHVSTETPLAFGGGLGGLGIEGVGLGIGDGDLQRGLDELARYARSLPSPIPPLSALDGSSDQPPSMWHYQTGLSDEDKTLMLRNLPLTAEPPLLTDYNPDSLVDDIPPVPPLPASARKTYSLDASTRSSVSRRSTGTGMSRNGTESDAYLSVDESGMDDLTTDDEDIDIGGGNEFSASFDQAVSKTYPEVTGSATVEVKPAWAEGDEEVLVQQVQPPVRRKGVFDWSDKSLVDAVVDPSTTHLILARSETPLLVPNVLRRTIPNLSFGLVVLDISNCQLIEVPYAVSSCRSLRELDIKGNPLAAGLPAFLGNLLSLKTLIADTCGLATLPSALSSLRKLVTLSVRFNNLRSLPGWLSRLTSLELLLVDGNDFYWQWADLVRPILLKQPQPPTESPAELNDLGSPAPQFATYTARSSVTSSTMQSVTEASPALSPALSNSRSSGGYVSNGAHERQNLHHTLSSSSLRPDDSYPFQHPSSATSSIMFPTSSGNQSPHSYSTPPPASSPHLELNEAQARLRHQSDRPRTTPASPVPSPGPLSSSTSATSESSKKWGKMFKKVSIKQIRPGGVSEGSRAYSAPATAGEESSSEVKSSGSSIFRSRVMSRPKPTPTPLPLPSERNLSKRQSFLKLEKVLPLDTMINSSSSPTTYSHEEIDQKAGLRSVMAYLRDLDDLTSESERQLRGPAAVPTLRTSPSLGSLRPSPVPSQTAFPIRRAQSSRRLPSRSPAGDSSSTFSVYDDSGSGRSTPLPAGADDAPPPPMKLRADLGKRQAVVREIIDTEKSYLKGLKELCGIYIAAASIPVSSSSGKKDTVVPAVERRAVFGNVEAIRDFHESIFLPDLIEAVRPSAVDPTPMEPAVRIAQVFIKHAAFLKIYSSYVNAFDSALARLQSWTTSTETPTRSRANSTASSPALTSSSRMGSPDPNAPPPSTLSTSQKKRVKSYLKRCRAHPNHSQISLESYLLLPVQRVPRYRMLLETLLSCTPADDSVDSATLAPHPTVLAAVEMISAVATDMNERKRESEGRSQLLVWQSRIGNTFRSPLVQPHRSLIRSGNFTLVRTVKRSSTFLETANRAGAGEPQDLVQVQSLVTETTKQDLIALLCTDLIVFVKAPSDPNDHSGPVDLFTVLRLNRAGPEQASPVTVFGGENMLRVVCDSRAILYLQASRRSEAIAWANATALQQSISP